MTSLPTFSQWARAAVCPGSEALPHVHHAGSDYAYRGNAIHAFLHDVPTHGVEEALSRVPAEFREDCAAIELADLPLDENAERETALAYDLVTRKARLVGRNIGRNYGELGPNEIAGTLDVMLVGDDRVLVADYKTGHGHVDEPDDNWQMRLCALAACAYTGKRNATVSIIHIREDGSIWDDTTEIDEFDLAAIYAGALSIAQAIRSEQAKAADDVVPNVSEGEHCAYCPAFDHCPAKFALIKRLVGDPGSIEAEFVKALNGDQRAQAYVRFRQLQCLIGRVGAAFHQVAREAPITLDDGYVFGEVESERLKIDGGVAFEIIKERLGLDAAISAVKMDATKAGLERAARDAKLPIAKTRAELLAQIEAAGGVTRTVARSVREHRPKETVAVGEHPPPAHL